MAVDVLVIGSGAREHALAWKLKQSPRIGKLYIAPGNPGTRDLGENVSIDAMDFQKLAAFAEEHKIGLTIVGPEDPLGAGIVDVFQSRKLRIFGPTKEAAQVESSKAFAKALMKEAKVPTAEFGVFDNSTAALAHVRLKGVPIVIKASGFALGKGVYVCHTLEEAEAAINEIMVEKVYKDSGNEVVIEEFMEGQEVSIHALSDGITHYIFPASQDHKRALDGDNGKNTGGMGTIAPLPWVTTEMMASYDSQVVAPTFEILKKRGIEFKGVLFPGLMVTKTGPKVLEYNARFGNPETEVYMRLFASDLLDLLEACVDGTLDSLKHTVKWKKGFAANIVLASGGYPDSYEKGFPITGIKDAEKLGGVVVFHAGTKIEGDQLVTAGGRVLSVSAVGDTLQEALELAYKAVEKIHFQGMQFRRDIGNKALGGK